MGKMIVLWVIVGVPLLYGVGLTLINVAKLFQ